MQQLPRIRTTPIVFDSRCEVLPHPPDDATRLLGLPENECAERSGAPTRGWVPALPAVSLVSLRLDYPSACVTDVWMKTGKGLATCSTPPEVHLETEPGRAGKEEEEGKFT